MRPATRPAPTAPTTNAASEVSVAEVPDELRKRIPYARVPATLLGRLAVDQRFARRGLGSFLLLDAAARALDPAVPASLAMIVDPLDEAASAWYRRFGFIPFAEPHRLFLPLETLRRALTGL